MSMTERYHAADGGDLFAAQALCGVTAADEPDGVLRLHQGGMEVTCTDCRFWLVGGRPE